MIDISGKSIVILGAQRSGLALVRLVRSKGGLAKISEQANRDDLSPDVIDAISDLQVEIEYGGHSDKWITTADLLVLSPGVSIHSDVVRLATEAGVVVCGEIEFAFQFCPKPIIAVTGSNGKTTVVTLIDQILRKSGHRSCLCGNIGYPFSDGVIDIDQYDYVVLEVSSFQMESVTEGKLNNSDKQSWIKGYKPFKPFIALLTNFNQNHLDRHQDLNEYFLAKKRIFINQNKDDYAILDKDAENFEIIENGVRANIVHFSSKHDSDIQEANPNLAAVLKVANILNINGDICIQVFKEFKGVEHRMEWVRNLEGVDFINDSKATTAESCLWALSRINQPVVLICGGRDKNIDYCVINDAIKKRVKKIFAIGEAKEKITQSFHELTTVEMCDELEQAVKKAKEETEKGGCVLFSPMCASFDMFCNFEERGRVFKEIVNEL